MCIWKPSEKTPLCSVACQNLIIDVLKENNIDEGVSCVVNGGAEVGSWIADDQRISLVSATGSTKMGVNVSKKVGARLGKTILELGGNNAIIITPNADLDIAIRASIFGAVGTCGQRCTSTRRLIVHESIFIKFTEILKQSYEQLRIGNPIDEKNHIGPLIDENAVSIYSDALKKLKIKGVLG